MNITKIMAYIVVIGWLLWAFQMWSSVTDEPTLGHQDILEEQTFDDGPWTQERRECYKC